MDAKTLELMLINHNRVMALVYQSMDIDWERERDYHAEELKLETERGNRDRY